ncbi:hypothetical protein WJX73_005310 [Symbiochloris irregularis]|uniref:Uncharacterized protein n=1 Tax=Symbiochloris irregularis TaxID=706552 RepID=A0AAW1P6S8_9CHLO
MARFEHWQADWLQSHPVVTPESLSTTLQMWTHPDNGPSQSLRKADLDTMRASLSAQSSDPDTELASLSANRATMHASLSAQTSDLEVMQALLSAQISKPQRWGGVTAVAVVLVPVICGYMHYRLQ